MTTLQEEWKSSSDGVGRLKLLAARGRGGVVQENRSLLALHKQYRTGVWPFCVAQALVRSRHARGEEGWFRAAAAYLNGGERSSLTAARGFSSSFGPDALQRALMSFRTVGDLVGVAAIAGGIAAQVVGAQERAVQYAMKRELPGLGAWLFCAPFEILSLVRPSLWEDPCLDQILLPLGSPLARGFGLLRTAGMIDVDEQLLRDTEPGLRNGLTLLYIARGCEQKLAKQANCHTLFIHRGIDLLGRVRG